MNGKHNTHLFLFGLIAISSIAGIMLGNSFAARLFSNAEHEIAIQDSSASHALEESEHLEVEEEIVIEPAPPQMLSIPAIGVVAPVEPVGLDEENKMDAPENPDYIGWYMYGAMPGKQGNAVLAGHFDSTTGPAVFYRLNELQAGDEIIVTDSEQNEHRFIVTRTASHPLSQFPMDEVFGTYDGKRLNLITCEGVFNRSTQLYSHRTVVYAELAE